MCPERQHVAWTAVQPSPSLPAGVLFLSLVLISGVKMIAIQHTMTTRAPKNEYRNNSRNADVLVGGWALSPIFVALSSEAYRVSTDCTVQYAFHGSFSPNHHSRTYRGVRCCVQFWDIARCCFHGTSAIKCDDSVHVTSQPLHFSSIFWGGGGDVTGVALGGGMCVIVVALQAFFSLPAEYRGGLFHLWCCDAVLVTMNQSRFSPFFLSSLSI